jgi:hypothetical protein
MHIPGMSRLRSLPGLSGVIIFLAQSWYEQKWQFLVCATVAFGWGYDVIQAVTGSAHTVVTIAALQVELVYSIAVSCFCNISVSTTLNIPLDCFSALRWYYVTD